MDEKNTLENLKKAWDGVTGDVDEMISKADRDYLEHNPNFNKKFIDNFNFKVHPHPWFGNIENPSIVVLAINPGYSKNADELDSVIFKELLDNNLKMKFTNKGAKLFDDEGVVLSKELSVPFKYSSVSNWWEKVFEEVLVNKDTNELDKQMVDSFYSKVAIFNLVGYQSKDADKIGKTYKNLPTTAAMIEHVKHLDNGERLFIFVWGEKRWNELGFEVGKCDKIVVNKQCGRYKYIRNEEDINKIKEKLKS